MVLPTELSPRFNFYLNLILRQFVTIVVQIEKNYNVRSHPRKIKIAIQYFEALTEH